MTQRLTKIIATSTIYSRREAERLILDAKVRVDQTIVTDVGFKINDGTKHKLYVNEELIDYSTNALIAVWLYYKPVGVITSFRDPYGRPAVFDRIRERYPHLAQQKIISVGRLDINSEGLLVLTNHGQFARYLELPQNKVMREYKVRVYCERSCLEAMLRYFNKNTAITIDNINYCVDRISLISSTHSHHWLKLSLSEGKNREIRKIFAFFYAQVSRLIRVRYGPFQLGALKRGEIADCSNDLMRKYFPDLIK